MNKPDAATLNKGYLPIYYPDAAFLSSATALCVGAGEQLRVDFHLRARATYSVHAKLALPADFKRNFEPLSGLRNEYGELVNGWTEEYDHNSKMFTVGRLAPGSYEIETATGIYSADPTVRRKFIITDADVDGLLLPMQPLIKLRMKVHLPRDFQPSSSYSVLLRLQREGEAIVSVEGSGWPVTKEGELRYPALGPGHYRLFLFGDDPLYLKSAHFGQQDVLANGLTLERAAADALVVTLERATGEIRGAVMGKGSLPLSSADVKLVAQGEDSR